MISSTSAIFGGYLGFAVACAAWVAVLSCKALRPTTGNVLSHLFGGFVFLSAIYAILMAGFLVILVV